MDFEPSSEQQMLIDQVRRYVREEIIPLEARLDPDASELDPADQARLVEKTKAMGLYGIDIPKEFGGPDIDIVTRVLLAIEMAQHRAGLYVPCYGTFGGAGTLLKQGTGSWTVAGIPTNGATIGNLTINGGMVILGSANSLIGPVLGAAFFLCFRDVLSDYTEHWMLYFGPLLVARVLLVKDGIWGMLLRAAGAEDKPAMPKVDFPELAENTPKPGASK